MRNGEMSTGLYPGVYLFSRPPGFIEQEEEEEVIYPAPKSNLVTVTCTVNSPRQNWTSVGHSTRTRCSNEIVITPTNSPLGRGVQWEQNQYPRCEMQNHQVGPEFDEPSTRNKLCISKVTFDLNRTTDEYGYPNQPHSISRLPHVSDVVPIRVHFNQSPEISGRGSRHGGSQVYIRKAPQRFQVPLTIQIEKPKEKT
ncbi:hypothetical protein D915_001727 [Fasciola hepatica]|uniref:Uncharacterized protein n=1 Tax=Fasciola hepatica TaxID=6192 RepID=A0A4E0RWW8_FASHE|nr:hypothetical protein D915_001727 [Fasciola hepatica]